MTNKICNYSLGALSLTSAIGALAVMGAFERGEFNYLQFSIGLLMCCAVLGLSIFLQWLLSKKRKSPRGAATPSKALRNKTR